MRKWVRVVSLGLAALMILGTLVSVFSMLAYAATATATYASNSSSSSSSSTSSDSSSSSSSSDEDFETTGSLRMLNRPLFQEVDQDGELVKDEDKYTGTLSKNRTYRVILNVIDTATRFDEVASASNGENYSDYDYALEKLGIFDMSGESPCVAANGYVVSNGGNIITGANRNNTYFDPTLIAYNKGGSTGLVLIFYVSPNGKGRRMNLDVWYDYQGNEGTSRATGTISMRVGEAQVDPDEEDDEDVYKIPTPNIIITSYNYGGQQIMAGSEFPINIKFRNTSEDIGLENIIVNLTTSADLSVSQGSNSNFITKLEGGGTGEMSTVFSVSTTIEPKPQQVTVKFTYEYVLNKERKTIERTETLAIPIVQLDRFQVGELSVPDQIWPGDTSYISLEYVNKGKGEVANLSGRLETSVPGVGEVQNVGNVKAGDSGTIEFTFTVNDPGPVDGKIIVTYEDLKGAEKTVERVFTATVMDMGGGGEDIGAESPIVVPEDTGFGKTAMLMAGAGGLLLAGLVFAIVVRRAKIKREEDSDEDL